MYGSRAKLGFIVPANNTVLEPELYSCAIAGVSLHFTKIDLRRTAYENVDKTAAVRLLEAAKVDVIGYACMSGSLIEADDWEVNVTRQTDIPAFTAATALKDAARVLDVKNLGVVTYYPEQVMSRMREWFGSSGLTLLATETLNISNSQSVCDVSPETIYRLAKQLNSEDPDVLCVLATDLCTFPIIEQLEQEIGKPVISSNQTILWKAMRLAGLPEFVRCGSLFKH